MLAFCLIGTAPLELWLHVGVYRRWRRLVLTVVPVLVVFLAWDGYAVHHGQWSFDRAQTLALARPWGLPIEEVLFFVVVPIATVLTFEAVRTVRGWPVGDEP